MPVFYLSFQRAPSVNVYPDEAISVSPTIVNDLRDEVYQPDAKRSPLKIRLAWIGRQNGTWVKLSAEIEIRWEGARSAYKPTQVKVPDKISLQGLSSIHLAAWAAREEFTDARPAMKRRNEPPGQQEWVYDLGNLPYPEEDRLVILPVLSAPIKVLSREKDGGTLSSKSSTTVRLFQIEDSPIVEICEESGYELDKHIWDASLYLTSYISKSLKENAPDTVLSILTAENFSKGLRVIELGAGTGMVSLLLSTLLARVSIGSNPAEEDDIDKEPIHLTATDLPSAIPLLERNIASNRVHAGRFRIDCQPLDWSDEGQIEGTQLILVSDCTYNPTYFKPLCKTIKSLLSKGKQPAICLLAKKHRHADEEGLWDEVKEHGLKTALLAGRQSTKEGHWGMWELSCD